MIKSFLNIKYRWLRLNSISLFTLTTFYPELAASGLVTVVGGGGGTTVKLATNSAVFLCLCRQNNKTK